MPMWIWFIAMGVVIALLLAAIKALSSLAPDKPSGTSLAGGASDPIEGPPPFVIASPFLSAAEGDFFAALQRAVPGESLIFAKVRVADVLAVPSGTPRWQAWMNRVQSKHFDFLLCDRRTLAPIAAIELDDSSHNQARRIERDAAIEGFCLAAELPLIRFRARSRFNPTDIRRSLAERLSPEPQPVP